MAEKETKPRSRTRSHGQEEALSRKERIDVARSIADFHLARVASRHAVEWRLAFGVWAVLLVSIVGIKVRPSDVHLGIALAIATPLFVFLVSWIGAKNAHDARRAYYYIDLASAGLRGEAFGRQEPRAWLELKPRERWARWGRSCLSAAFAVKAATTVTLAIFAFLFAGRVSG